MKIINIETDSALNILACIAGSERLLSAYDLCKQLEISHPFTRKITQLLSGRGYLKSVKGRNGGFLLMKKPSDISIYEIAEIFQNRFSEYDCESHKKICPRKKDCRLRGHMIKLRKSVLESLKNLTLDKISDSAVK